MEFLIAIACLGIILYTAPLILSFIGAVLSFIGTIGAWVLGACLVVAAAVLAIQYLWVIAAIAILGLIFKLINSFSSNGYAPEALNQNLTSDDARNAKSKANKKSDVMEELAALAALNEISKTPKIKIV